MAALLVALAQQETPIHAQLTLPSGGAVFQWIAADGDVSNAENWDYQLGNYNAAPPPGALDYANIADGKGNFSITVTGSLNVYGAGIGAEQSIPIEQIVTMAGSVTTGFGGLGAENAIFEGSVSTTGSISAGNVVFQSSVYTALGLSAGAIFTSGATLNSGGPVLAGTLTFLAGSSGASQIGTSQFYAANPGVFFSNTTALQVGGTLSLTGASFTANGDTVAGTGTVSMPSTIQISMGGSLVTTGNLLVGVAYANGSLVASGSGLVTVNSGSLQAQEIIVGDGGPGALNVSSGGQVTSTSASANNFVGLGSNSPSTVDIASNGQWTVAGNLFLGFTSEGQMTVESGGTLAVANGLFIGSPAAGGSGSLTIQTGGIVNTGTSLGVGGTGAEVGGPAGEIATVTVNGSNSKWTSNGAVLIGSGGDGTLTVSNGATVSVQTNLDIGFYGTGASGGMMVISSGGTVTSGAGLSAGALAGKVGVDSGATGAVTITGAGSTWDVKQNLNIGQSGTGTVTVQNGGTLEVDGSTISIGAAAGGTGTLIFDKAGGTSPTFTFNGGASDQLLIGDQGAGHFFVQGGAQISTTSSVIIGNGSTGVGAATLQGQGSSWNITGNVTVGLSGTGTLTVMDGNTLTTNGGNIILGQQAGSTGTLVLDGAGSGFDLSGGTNGQLTIGQAGAGILQVQNGASVNLGSTVLGNGSQGTGEINVIGANSGPVSSVYISGTLTVGGSSSGSGPTQSAPLGLDGGVLSISGGGSVTVTNGNLVVARDAGSTGEIDMSGQNSSLTIGNNGTLIIGQAGLGALNISNQATLSVFGLTIAQNGPAGDPSQVNRVVVTGSSQGGAQTILTVTNALTVGNSGTGELDVTAGAVLQTFQTVNIGNQSSGVGTVSLTGSTWNATGGQINIGVNGAGTVELQNGAVLENVNNISIAGAGGTGTLSVITANAQVNALNLSGSGNNSSGTLSILQGGNVQSMTLVLDGNTSNITVDGKASASSASSTLSVGSLSFGSDLLNSTITVSGGGQFIVAGGSITTPAAAININVTGQGSAFSAPNSPFTLGSSNLVGVTVYVSGGGTLVTGATALGQNASVIIAHFGDTVTSTWNVTAGAGAIGGSTLAVSGGSLEINSGGTVNVAGEAMVSGALSSSIELSGNPGNPAAFTASQIDITQNGAVTLSFFSQVTASGLINIQSGGDLQVSGLGANVSSATMTIGVDSFLRAANYSLVSVGSRLVVSGTLDVRGGGQVDIGAVLNGAPNGNSSIAIGFGGVLKNSGNVFASTIDLGFGAVAGGSGNYNGAVINGGKIAPGDPQTMTINGSYTQLSSGTLDLQVAGSGPGQADQLVVNGPATIAGYLELDFINGFAPTTGETFNLLTSTSLTGQFSAVEVTGLASGWTYTLTPSSAGFTLTSDSNAVSSPEFVVSPGPNVVLTGGSQITPGENVHFVGGTLEAVSNAAISNPVILDVDGGTFQADAGTSSILSGIMSGPGSFTKTGPGLLTLSGNNTYLGGTAINGGELAIFSDSNLGAAGTALSFDGGFLQTLADLTSSRAISLNAGGGGVDTNGFNASLTGVLSGPGSLTKIGAGTLTLTAQNLYSGGTVIDGGVLAIFSDANLGAPGSLVSFGGGTLETLAAITSARPITLNAGGGTLDTDGFDLTLTGIITGAGSLTKTGAGTLFLEGQNTYTGPTLIENGQIYIDGSVGGDVQVFSAGFLGGHGVIAGSLFNSGIVSPGNSPGTLTVTGNYAQSSAGALVIEIGGTSAGSHDLLAVGGHATLGGALQLVRLNNFELQRGDKITFLTAGGGVSGAFSTVQNPFANFSGTILEAEVAYGANSVSLEELPASFQKFAETSRLAPNEISVGAALDSAVSDPRANALITYLEGRSLSQLPGDLEKIDPEQLTSMFTVATALANVQSLNLQRRAEDIRSGSSGFSAAGFAMNSGNPGYSGAFGLDSGIAGPAGPDGKTSLDGKKMKEETPPIDQRWGAFLSGTGEWLHVGNTDDARGYSLDSGGFTLGVDYKATEHFAIGLSFGYTGTTSDLTDRGRIWVNGGKVGIYATAFSGGWYVDAAVNGGYNSYDTRRSALEGEARGLTDGGELNALFGAGYDFRKGALTFGPTATFNYTYAGLDGFSENGSLAPLDIRGGDEESLRTALGFKMGYDWKVAKVLVKPQLRVAWQHEFGDTTYALNSSFANSAGDVFTVDGPRIGRDSALLSAGFAIQFNERVSAYVYYDGELGRTNYQANSVSGGLQIAF